MEQELLKNLDGIIRSEVPLAMHTWLQLGGPAEFFAEPRSEEELLLLLRECTKAGVPIRTLGEGSNILISDSGVPGLVIRLTDPVFCDIKTKASIIEAGAGARLGRVITSAVYGSLAGLEGMIGIPGTVGGAIINNVSTSDGNIGEWVDSVRIATCSGEIQELPRDQIVFGYHNCSIGNAVITRVRFALTEERSSELAKRLQKNWIMRRKSEPGGFEGSVRLFKDLRGQNAADLIEDADLKGMRIGGARIYERNANFVVVDPDCSSTDVKRLIQLVERQVRERCEVDLELELEIW